MDYEEFARRLASFSGMLLLVFHSFSVHDCRTAKERVHLAYKHPELLLDLMKKGIISTSLACNDLEVNISACHDQQGDICRVRDNNNTLLLSTPTFP